MKKKILITTLALALASALFISCKNKHENESTNQESAKPTEQEINDAYLYMLSRYLIIQQENLDLKKMGYNKMLHNPLGDYLFVNPNMDVTISDAWLALDDEHAAYLNVPKIENRYYTAQIIDNYGEVITNINEREFPETPYGKFAFIKKGTNPSVDSDAVATIEVPNDKIKILTRVELKNDNEGAVKLQKAFTIDASDDIQIKNPIKIPEFTNAEPIAVEVFDQVEEVLTSQFDEIPNAEIYQNNVRKVANYVAKNAENRREVDEYLKNTVIPNFLKNSLGFGTTKDGWSVSYKMGKSNGDILTRTIINYGGIWANVKDEVLYFMGLTDNKGVELNGDQTYELHFPKDQLPESAVNKFWALTVYSVPDYKVVPNPINRYSIGTASNPKKNSDGSLTIWLAAEQPADAIESNWMPIPKGKGFALTFRTYVPNDKTKNSEWFPTPIIKK